MQMIEDGLKQTALILQGRGGLGAQEAGVVKTIIEGAIKFDNKSDNQIFDVLAGSSIGAINVAILVKEFNTTSQKDCCSELDPYS